MRNCSIYVLHSNRNLFLSVSSCIYYIRMTIYGNLLSSPERRGFVGIPSVNRAEGGRKKAKMGENGRWMGGGDGGEIGERLKFRGIIGG